MTKNPEQLNPENNSQEGFSQETKDLATSDKTLKEIFEERAKKSKDAQHKEAGNSEELKKEKKDLGKMYDGKSAEHFLNKETESPDEFLDNLKRRSKESSAPLIEELKNRITKGEGYLEKFDANLKDLRVKELEERNQPWYKKLSSRHRNTLESLQKEIKDQEWKKDNAINILKALEKELDGKLKGF